MMPSGSLYSLSGGRLRYNLHPGQTRAWDSAKRHVFIVAGTQSGKTSFEPVWLDREIRRCGEGDYLAVTATYDLFKLKFLPELLGFFVYKQGWDYSVSERVISRQHKPRLFTRIIMRSAESAGGLESATAKAALFDECGMDSVRVDVWEAILRRLSLAEGRVLGGTTVYNMGWLKSQIYEPWTKGSDLIEVIQFASSMNPAFPKAEYRRAENTLPGWKFRMLYKGEFARPAGMVYEDFGQALIVQPFRIPDAWPRFLGVDFGAVNTAKIWIAQDYHSDTEQSTFYLYRESLEGNRTTAGHVDEVKGHAEPALRIYGGAKSETQQRWDWNAAGAYVSTPPISDVEAGIDRVVAMLKHHQLYVFSSCVGVIDEFGSYSRKLDDEGKPTEELKDKSTYHRLDALRYVVSGLSLPNVGDLVDAI